MNRRAWVLFLLFLCVPTLALAGPVKTVAHVFAPNWQTIDRLSAFPVSFEESDREDYVRIVAYRDVMDDIRDAGFEVDVLIDDLDAWVDARSVLSREAALNAQAPKDPPVLDHYFDHAEVVAFLEDLALTYPTLMSLDTIGQSVNGRDIHLVKISDNVNVDENEPALFFEHTIHGDELAGYTVALNTIEWLLTEYGVDPDVTAMVDGRELFFVPLTNPDGNYDHPTYGPSRYNENGVDLNRNNGFMWDPFEYNSGDALHSEPETQALADVWAGDQPFVFGVSAHSGTVSISLPWSYHLDSPGDWDEFDFLGEGYCDACLDSSLDDWFQGSQGMYQIHGSTKDEMYGSHGMAAWTVELTYSKQCTFSQAIEVAGEHEPSLMWLFEQAGEGVHGTVTAADSKAPLAATVWIGGKWYTFTDPGVGDFHKFLLPGEYNVHIEAAGHLPFDSTIQVAAGDPAIVTAALTADPNPKSFAYRWIHSECPNSEVIDEPAHHALGRPDGDFFSLGNSGWALLDLGPDGAITDGAGADVAVYESHTDGDEDFTLEGKENWQDAWAAIGAGVGTSEFDLSASTLTTVRYLRISDGSKARDDRAAFDGFDLDAIGTPALVAAFTASTTSGELPLDVQFTDVSTGSPTSWSWTFGDGGTSTAQDPSHTFAASGAYTVALTINGPGGTDTLTKTDYVDVYYAAPVAEFTGDPTSGSAPLAVSFTDASTGEIDTYLWEFGDGETSAAASPDHTYTAAGEFTVRLTVTGPGGDDLKRRWKYIDVAAGDDDDDDDDDDDNDDDDDDDNDDDNDDNDDDTPTPDDDDDTSDAGDDDDVAADDDDDDDDDSGGCN
jgi:PKD repeat protein